MTDPNVEAVRDNAPNTEEIAIRISVGGDHGTPRMSVAFRADDDTLYSEPGIDEIASVLRWLSRQSEAANDAVDRACVRYVVDLFEMREEDGADTLGTIIGMMDSLWTGSTRSTNATELAIALNAKVFSDTADKMLDRVNAEMEANTPKESFDRLTNGKD